VERRLPSWRVRRPGGGLVAWFELPEPRSSALVHEARRHGVRLVAGPRFAVDAAFERFVRLPYSLPPDLLVEAVERIVPAWAAATGHAAEQAGPGPL
jgi:DNA-binding transcriptional MocR family regulator